MLGGGDQDALLHQACGVADAGDVAAYRLDLKAVEVNAAEDNAGVRRSRENSQLDRRT